jgi:hypothetical protein
MTRLLRIHPWLMAACFLVAGPTYAADADLMGLDVEGVRLGMSTPEAGAALDNRGYKQSGRRSFKRKDRNGVHYVGLKLNPAGEVISVEVAHFLTGNVDPDANRDRWGKPDRRMGNPGHVWKYTYENANAIFNKWARASPAPGRDPSELRTRLVAKHQVLASRRGHEVSSKICMAIKDKPVSMLNVNDRNHLMECLRTGQLRIVAPK